MGTRREMLAKVIMNWSFSSLAVGGKVRVQFPGVKTVDFRGRIFTKGSGREELHEGQREVLCERKWEELCERQRVELHENKCAGLLRVGQSQPWEG